MVEPGGSGSDRCCRQASSCGASGTDAVCLARRASSRLRQRLVLQRQDLRGEQAGVGGAGLADRQRADRHAGRHLHDGEQAVLARQRLGGDGHAEHGQHRHGCGHAGQVRRPAGAGDDHLEAARLGALGIVVEPLGRAVGRDHLGLVGDARARQHVGGVLHGGPVGQAAHDDADFGMLSHGPASGPPRKRALKGTGIALARPLALTGVDLRGVCHYADALGGTTTLRLTR